jgi:hypothetical protein
MRMFWLVAVACSLGAGCGGCDDGSVGPDECASGLCCAGNEVVCGDSCLDVASDSANCGACGHDCGGTACSAGVCMPLTLAVVANAPAQLADDGADLTFATRGELTSSGAVYRLAKAGGTPSVIYRGLADNPVLAIADDRSILVADSGQASGCQVTGSAGSIITLEGSTPPALLSMGRRCVASLTATPTGFAWIEDVPRRIFGGGDPEAFIASLPSNASPQQAPTIVRDRVPGRMPRNLQRVGDALMWTERDSILELTGTTPTTVASISDSFATISAFAADANEIVYASGSTLVLRSRATAAERTLTSDLDRATLVALDADFIYVVTDAALVAIDKQSGRQWPLLDGFGLEGLAQDDRFIYTLRTAMRSGPQTEVVRVRKPALAAAMLPGPFQCELPLESCAEFDATCIDLNTDPNHCSDCDVACASVESCVGGSCTCAASSRLCNGACVDPAIDPASCGACDRSCNGGTCAGGDCMPVKLANFANAGVHDAAAIYYAVSSQIRRLDKQSSTDTLITQLAQPYVYARYLAHDDSRIFIAADMGTIGSTNPGGIYSVAKAGATAPTALYVDRPDPRHIAIAPNAIVWVEDASALANAPAKLVYAATNGSAILGSFQPVGLYAGSNDDESRGVLVVGSSVYWLLADPAAQTGAILQVDLAASSPTLSVLALLDVGPYSFTAVGSELYVTGGWPNGKLFSIPLAGGAASIHATGLLYPSKVAAAPDGAVLWVDPDRGRSIHERAPNAALARVVQSGNHVDGTTVLLVDATRLFTISSNGVYVMQR